jgi:hypothetical protein
MTPALQADNTAIAGLQKDIGDLKKQIATASTQPSATQPSADGSASLLTQLLAAEQKKNSDLIAAQAKKDADTTAAQENQVKQVGQTAQTVAGAIPGPWGDVVKFAIGLGTLIVLSKIHKGTVQTLSDNNAQTAQTTSNNNAATVQTAVTNLANSVPVASLPASIQPIARVGVAAVNAGVAAIQPPPVNPGT